MNGNGLAWVALIDKYKHLIFSIPIKYGATREDAADMFQAVCIILFSELSNLQKAGSLRSWIFSITLHQVYHWKQKKRRRSVKEATEINEEALEADAATLPDFIESLERQQLVREAIAQLPTRCNELIRMLFYEQPPIPYNEAAQRLGLATGSIGFVRGRCLHRLQKLLEGMGF